MSREKDESNLSGIERAERVARAIPGLGVVAMGLSAANTIKTFFNRPAEKPTEETDTWAEEIDSSEHRPLLAISGTGCTQVYGATPTTIRRDSP